MKESLNKIRIPDKNLKMKNKILNTFLIFLFGVILGIFSKWLDNLSIDDSVWWQDLLGMLDLRNVFSLFGIWLFIAITISIFSKTPRRASINVLLFFLGMTISYHLYTIFFSGFNPIKYMMIWYGFTLTSPLLAYVCWYAKGKSKVSMLISSLILSIMFISPFNIGIWYFNLKSVIDLLIFIGTIIVLNVNPKNTICSLFISIILAFIVCGIVVYIPI